MEYPARYNLPPLIEPMLIGVGQHQTKNMYARTFKKWEESLTEEQLESYEDYKTNVFIAELFKRSNEKRFDDWKAWMIKAMDNYVDES